jgi:hypothetical protein
LFSCFISMDCFHVKSKPSYIEKLFGNYKQWRHNKQIQLNLLSPKMTNNSSHVFLHTHWLNIFTSTPRNESADCRIKAFLSPIFGLKL